MNPLGWRPLKEAQDYYRYLTVGSDWTETRRAVPAIGYHVYMLIDRADNSGWAVRTEEKKRGYLSDDGWRYVDGRLLEKELQVVVWMYDETSRNCVII